LFLRAPPANAWYGPYESPKGISDLTGPAQGRHRVLRDGLFILLPEYLHAADRYWYVVPEVGNHGVGFRVARTYQLFALTTLHDVVGS
jgi:hypothetical protein